MNTKLIMALTAGLLVIIGLLISFAPDIVAESIHLEDSAVVLLILQLLGGVYCAFALMNWMAKGALIGGIYNRPIAIGNFTHFIVAGLALTKFVLHDRQFPVILCFMAGCFVLLAGVFGLILFRHPAKY